MLVHIKRKLLIQNFKTVQLFVTVDPHPVCSVKGESGYYIRFCFSHVIVRVPLASAAVKGINRTLAAMLERVPLCFILSNHYNLARPIPAEKNDALLLLKYRTKIFRDQLLQFVTNKTQHLV